MLKNFKIAYTIILSLLTAVIIFGCEKGHTPGPPTGSVQRTSINLTSSAASIEADGLSTATLTAQVYSDINVLVADGTEVKFTTSSGTFVDSGTNSTIATTINGVATATLTSSTTAEIAYIQANCVVLGVTATETITFTAGALASITISSSANEIKADGTSTATITASLFDSFGNPVETSTTVTFDTTAGSLDTTSVTTTSGKASVILTSVAIVKTATITATVGTLADSVDVNFVAQVAAVYTITLSSLPGTIPADGYSTSTITALLVDSNNNPLPDQQLNFSTTVGTITASAKTNESGVAIATLTSVREEATATITASFGGISGIGYVNITGIFISLEANPKSALSDGVSTSTVTLTLKDASDAPIQGKTVTLSETSSLGVTITPAIGVTDPNGQLSATISSTTSGVAEITASGAGASASTNITFTAYVFELTTDSSTVETCGGATEFITVTASLTETGSGGVAGQTVNFYSTHGGFTDYITDPLTMDCELDPSGLITATDNGDGTYSAYFWGQGTTGTATISAEVTYDNTVLQDTTDVSIVATTPSNILLTASPNRINYGGDTSTITAIITDSTSNPVANCLVSFQITNGPGGTEKIVPFTGFTNADGKATATFTSGNLGSFFEGVTIKGSVAGGSGTLTDTVKLTITGPPVYVAIGTANELIDEGDGLFKQYIIVAVKDIYGNDVADGTNVSLGVHEVGFYLQDGTYLASEDSNENGLVDCEDKNFNCILDAGEDQNGNGLLDCEDGSTGYLKNGIIDPQSTAILPSIATTTGGLASVFLQYAQSDACNIRIRIDASSGGIKASPLTKNLETTIQLGCPQDIFYNSINPAGGESTFSYSTTIGSPVVLSISDYSIDWEYTWDFLDAPNGTINGVAGPVSGVGLNFVTYISNSAGSDTITVGDCDGNIKLINIIISTP